MKTLAYWKSRLADAKSAYKQNKTREFACAVRFAYRKVREIERKILVHVVCLAVVFVAGCNTIAGIGKDLQNVAEGTQYKMAEQERRQSFSEWERAQRK